MTTDNTANFDAARQSPTLEKVTGIILEHLRNLFASSENIHSPALDGAVWDPDPLKSKIIIETATNWTPDIAGQVPALIVKRNQVNVRELSIGGKLHGQRGLLGTDGVDAQLGIVSDEVMQWLLHGSHSIQCIGGLGSQCEELASEVLNDLCVYRNKIKAQLNLSSFRPIGASAPRILDQYRDNYAVRIDIEWSAGCRGVLRTISPVLKGISTDKGDFFVR